MAKRSTDTAGAPSPRTKPPEKRREELLDAAQRVFLEQGVAPATIERITTAAEVAKGTFYLYFSSKESLLAALEERFEQQLISRIKAAVAREAEADWTGKLATWAAAAVAGCLDSIQLHDLLSYESRPATREGLVDNVVIDHLAALLQAGSDQGAWSVDDPRFTAVFAFSGLHAVVDDACAREKRIRRGRLVQRVQNLFLRAAGPPATMR